MYNPTLRKDLTNIMYDWDGTGILPTAIKFNTGTQIKYYKKGETIPSHILLTVTFAPTTDDPQVKTGTLSDDEDVLTKLSLIGTVSITEEAADVFVQLCLLDKFNGFKDFKTKSKASSQFYIFTKVESGGAYTYDNNTATFTASANGEYSRSLATAYSCDSNTAFVADATTSDLFFYRDSKSDSIVEAWIKIAPTCGSMKISYAGNGNYEFQPEQEYGLEDKFYLTEAETGSFDNTTIRVDGSKKYHSCFMNIHQPIGDSIRFKVVAVEENDKFEIYSIELANAGYLVDGGDNG